MTKLAEAAAKYFPYPEVRPFQDDFINTIFNAVEERHSVIIEGSNGLGKTIAVLSACLPKAIDKKLKILYVARTHRQHDRVIEELRNISDRQEVSGLSVRGRHEMCLNPFVKSNAQDTRAVMDICELLKAKNRCPYYRNIEEKKDQYLEIQRCTTFRPYKASEIQKICQSKGFCPYELVKESLADVTVIALSYLYVFDPTIRAVFLANLNVPLNKIILVIDEAHNLPETAVDIASNTLTIFAMRQAENEANQFRHKDIAAFARTIRNEIEDIAEKIPKESLVSPESLMKLVQEKAGVGEPRTFFEHLYATGNAIRRSLLVEGEYPRSFIHTMGRFFLKFLETVDDKSFINVITKYESRRGTMTAKLEIDALDPSIITEPIFSSVYSTIIMSGTLQPLDAYVRMTKLPENTVKSIAPSPFPKEHVLPIISCGVTTAMEKRTPQMYLKIINRIAEIVQNTPANTGIFTSSFEVLEALRSNGLEDTLHKPLFHEHRNMTSKQNEHVIATFKTCAKRGGAVLLGVQGGRSSEGVDFPGDQMNSAVVVGIPYAEPTPRVKAQIDYYERRFPGLGREYGYVLPAMKRAAQAAGRPIRTLEDKGAIAFLDYRFSSPYLRSFLPAWIRNNLKILPDEDGAIAQELHCFFRRVS